MLLRSTLTRLPCPTNQSLKCATDLPFKFGVMSKVLDQCIWVAENPQSEIGTINQSIDEKRGRIVRVIKTLEFID